jgi:hypothetical protein
MPAGGEEEKALKREPTIGKSVDMLSSIPKTRPDSDFLHYRSLLESILKLIPPMPERTKTEILKCLIGKINPDI